MMTMNAKGAISFTPPWVSLPTYASERFWSTPMTRPPTIAPGTELRPPRTTAGSTRSPRYPTEMFSPLMFPRSVPPTPAAMKAMAQARAYTRLAETPRERAAISSSAVACMESPQRLRGEDRRREDHRVGPPDKPHQRAEKERQPRRDHDDGQDRLADHPPQEQPLGRQTQDEAGDQRGDEREGERKPPLVIGQADVGPDERQLPHREVQDAGALVDQRPAQGHQRVDRADHDPREHELQQDRHHAASTTRSVCLLREVRPSS